MKRLLPILLLASACSKGPTAALVVLADQDTAQVASLERGLFALAAGRENDGGGLSAKERAAAVTPEDGRVGPALTPLQVEVQVVTDEAAAQKAMTDRGHRGLVIAGSPRLARAAANAAVVVPGKVALVGVSREAGAAGQAWVASEEAGYLAGFAAAAASKAGKVALIGTGGIDEDAYVRAFTTGTTAYLAQLTEVQERRCRELTRPIAAAEVALAAAGGADVIAVTGLGEAGRGAVLDAVARGLAVVLPDGTLTGVAGPLLAGRVLVPWARLVYELVAHKDSLSAVTVHLRDGWEGLSLGPQLAGRPEVVARLQEISGGLRSGGLRTDRPAPGAKILLASERRVPLPEVAPPPVPPVPPPLRKHPTRHDFQPWDGKAR